MDNKVKISKKLYKKSTCREKPASEEADDKYESMSSLVAWNISKVLKSNPNIDLKSEITAMKKRLESKLWDVNSVTSDYPDQRYLACALLAWQQMGHGDANSLYQFILFNLNRVNANNSETLITEASRGSNLDISYESNNENQVGNFLNGNELLNSNTHPQAAPIMKLPVETKIVMRCDMCKPKSAPKSPQRTQNTDTKKNGDTPCCVKSACKQRLVEMDASTLQMKKRVQQLAKREEERQKLLTRAESAWKDLEKSYVRRLKAAEEKEDDISKQIKNSIEERNNYKCVCGALAKQLEEKGEVVQKEAKDLKKIESEVCGKARKKFEISENMACAESCLAQQHCRAAQIERDLRFKEDQVRRKVKNLEDSAESLRGLRCEAERALRAELGALKDEVAKVSKRLLLEESETSNIKNEVDELRVNKLSILEDLDACKIMCDHHMQGQIADLKKKTEELADIKEKLLECRCKLPQDTCVEVKRTPSLAAICRCSSEDNVQDSCSCTSLRSSLLSTLLKDLFGGLQSELGDNGSIMPCQLLKCLEDKHNWDRSTPVKTNLRSFFSKLLVGELDIAIASSIEKYHVKWVGTSCVDETSRIPDSVDVEEWQQKALENRAQNLAKKLAEQLFQEKADELIEKAKGIVAVTPPPCQCGKQSPSMYPCIVHPHMNKLHYQKSIEEKSASVEKRIDKNAIRVQVQLAEHKTKLAKKNTLKPTRERNINRIQRPYGLDYNTSPEPKKGKKGMSVNQKFNHRAVSTDRNENLTMLVNTSKKNKVDKSTLSNTKKYNKHQDKIIGKCFNRPTQSYAVNLCLYEPQRDQNAETRLINKSLDENTRESDKFNLKDLNNTPLPYLENNTHDLLLDNSTEEPLQIPNSDLGMPYDLPCSDDCGCLNKAPSNTSVNKLLEIFLHDEISNLTNKKIINVLQSNDKNIKMYQEIFTNTDHENKCYKCESTIVDHLQFYKCKESSVNYGDFAQNEINEIKDQYSRTNGVNEKTNLHDSDNLKKNTILLNETTIDDNCKRFSNFESNRYFDKQERPTHDKSCKYTSMEKNNCNVPTSAQSFLVQSNKNNINLIANYIVDTSKTPLDSNCKVEFLGVTLNNNESNIKSNQLLKNITSNRSVSASSCQCVKNASKKKCENIAVSKDNLNNNYKATSYDDIPCNNLKDLSYKNTLLDNKSNCICCSKVDDNKDLEMNTFDLLAEYLQKKLEEFKLSTSKSCCLLPYEEDLLYTDILKRVKNTILEMNNEVACKCFESQKNNDIDASWKRACSLLQEYLRIKIKRIKCSCSVTIKNSQVILPDMLEKVCQLIENDFKQLKKTFADKKVKEKTCLITNENQTIDNMTYGKQLKNNFNNNNTNKIFISSRGKPDIKNILGVNCEPSPLLNVHKPLQNVVNFEEKNVQTVLSKLLSDSFGNDLNKKNIASQFTLSLNNTLDEKVFKSIFPEENAFHDISITENQIKNLSVPYIGYTLDCTCDKILGPCICPKSALESNKNKTDNIWKIKANKNLSYIMQSVIEANASDTKIVDYIMQQENNFACDKEIDTNIDEYEITLKESNQNIEKLAHNFTNTSHIYIYDDVDYLSYDDWDDCESSYCPNLKEASTNKEQLYDSLLLPLEDLSSNVKCNTSLDSDDALKTEIRPQDCTCDMVPICHVKMLINNIGRQLKNSNCTCDSLNPNVCPVHFEI